MKAIKISTTIICLVFFILSPLGAEQLYCKKYSGISGDYTLSLSFSKKGKMLISVNSKKGQGFYSSPGSYKISDGKMAFFHKGLYRTMYIHGNIIKASLYSFGINDDHKNTITLREDNSPPSSCR